MVEVRVRVICYNCKTEEYRTVDSPSEITKCSSCGSSAIHVAVLRNNCPLCGREKDPSAILCPDCSKKVVPEVVSLKEGEVRRLDEHLAVKREGGKLVLEVVEE